MSKHPTRSARNEHGKRSQSTTIGYLHVPRDRTTLPQRTERSSAAVGPSPCILSLRIARFVPRTVHIRAHIIVYAYMYRDGDDRKFVTSCFATLDESEGIQL